MLLAAFLPLVQNIGLEVELGESGNVLVVLRWSPCVIVVHIVKNSVQVSVA